MRLDLIVHLLAAYVVADALEAFGCPFGVALAGGATACLGKEAVDRWVRNGTWDWIDLFFGGLGLLGWVCLHFD